jgi:hypothetical protein
VWESEDSDLRLVVAGDGTQAALACVMRWAPEWMPVDLGAVIVERTDLRAFAQELRAFVTGD